MDGMYGMREKKSACRILLGNLNERDFFFLRLSRGWDNVTVDLSERAWTGLIWHMIGNSWRAVVNAVMNVKIL
jgi:hypothetical protein